MYAETSICSGSSGTLTSNLDCTSFQTFSSWSDVTKEIAKPFVPNLPARPTYFLSNSDTLCK